MKMDMPTVVPAKQAVPLAKQAEPSKTTESQIDATDVDGQHEHSGHEHHKHQHASDSN